MAQQKKLSWLAGRIEAPTRMARRTVNAGASNTYEVFDFFDGIDGTTIFSIATNDIFDRDGNRFEDDLA